jgi:ATP-dependent exoDNAse (exonuclease V) alpha subunit
VFAYTNADVALLNADLRAVRRQKGELGEDHEVPTADGRQMFATGDRLQFTGTDKKRGLYNGIAGTVSEIDGTRLMVQLDGRHGETRTFDAADFQGFRHGYAGTIYKGQGRTLDQTYLYHSEHWRSAASYVALTRHRDKAELFVATNTAPDVSALARQMARVDERRAASQFHLVDPPEPMPARRADGGTGAALAAEVSNQAPAPEPISDELREARARLKAVRDREQEGPAPERDPGPEHSR